MIVPTMPTSIPETMKALKTLNGTVKVETVLLGSLESVKNLSPDHILVKTLAVSPLPYDSYSPRKLGLNPTDWKHAIGPWNPPGRSVITGCDFAGQVIEIGRNVQHIKVGDRVAGFAHGAFEETNGAYAEYVRCNKALAFVLPEGMSPVEGAAIPVC